MQQFGLQFSRTGDGKETETDRLFVCKCGDCAHDCEKRERKKDGKREFGVCVVGPLSRASAVLARDKTTCMVIHLKRKNN